MKKGGPPTMKDVAQEAGVSLGTVSRVLNGRQVGGTYRNKVMDAAARLGYQMNRCARGLKSGSTSTVALILPNLSDAYYTALAQSVCEVLREQGRGMLLFLSRQESERELSCLRQAQEHQVDGVIAVNCNSAMSAIRRVPMVAVDRVLSRETPCISADNFSGGMMAAEKLLELGCQKLLGVGRKNVLPAEADKRVDGFQAGCRNFNKEYELMFASEEGNDLHDQVNGLIASEKFPYDGIFCVSNVLAEQMLDVLREHQVSVPGQVQIIGFGGIESVAERDQVCSTMMLPVQHLAETAVTMLLEERKAGMPTLICLPVNYFPCATTRDGGA